MSKVTSKLQVTIPKAIAELCGIKPGDEIEFRASGETIRIIPPRGRVAGRISVEERLRLFDEATRRQRRRQKGAADGGSSDRGWAREELYERGRSS